MTDKNNESALLLRMNKEEQVSVLQEIGFTSVNENTPASDIAKYIRWAGGLLDLSFATIRIEDGVNVFFTAEEWNAMSEKQQQETLMNYRIAYLGNTMVNWCPELGTVLANDEVSEGLSIRGGYPVEQKKMRQW